ncbi:MAG: hypothetical protein ABIG69_12175 [Bacteroidota bacterium]
MIDIHKKIVNDENGNPSDVIIPWNEFKQIEEILGLDLDEKTIKELRQAQSDRDKGEISSYIALDDI